MMDIRKFGIASIRRTCSACPTQYDIILKDGRYIYFRYRSATWSMRIFPSKTIEDDISWEKWLNFPSIGERYDDRLQLDGYMDFLDVIRILKENLYELIELYPKQDLLRLVKS